MTIRDGFLYHPFGQDPITQIERLLAGEHNPVFDDLFSTTVQEVDDALARAERDREKLLRQLRTLRRKMLDLRSRRDEITDAVQGFKETGEIAPVLYPACEKLVTRERAALREADAKNKEQEIEDAQRSLKLPKGWDVAKTKADDEFVYVTIRRRRENVVEPPSTDETRERIVEKVRQAFDQFREDFINRVKPPLFWAQTGNPRASP